MRILVIEDDPQTIEMLVVELARDGHEVVGERTAAAGHRRATQESWDVIVSDIGLPDRSGFLLARQLRQAGVDVPLIALSGYDTPEDRRNGLESGFDEYLAKPIKASALREQVRLHAARPRSPKTVAPSPRSPTAPRVVVAEQPVAVPAPRRRGVLGGLVVIALGVPFVLQQLGVPNGASYLFITMGLAFLISYIRGRQYVYLIPMATLTSFGVGLLLPTWIAMRPDAVAPAYVGIVAIGFIVAFALAPTHRWPLVPAVLLGLVAAGHLVTGSSVIPAPLEPFLVPVVLIGVGAYLLAEPKS
jgi:CheY-like chemotaxis protein